MITDSTFNPKKMIGYQIVLENCSSFLLHLPSHLLTRIVQTEYRT